MNEPALAETTGPVQPVALSIEVGFGQIEIRTDATRRAAVRAEPMADGDQAALDLIRRARVTDTGDRLDVRFPDPPANAGGGGVVFGNVVGGMTFVNGNMIINGMQVGGGGSVNVTAIVPPGSSVVIRTKGASAKVIGSASGAVNSVNFNSTSGDLYAAEVLMVDAQSVSGDVETDNASDVRARTTSGDIIMGRQRGNATANSVSGDVRAHCVNPCVIGARTVSGDVRVTSAPGVRPRVNANSVSGDVRTS